MAINMHVHWIAAIVLLIGTFVANHYFNLYNESKGWAWTFYSLLLLMFAASGYYLWRVVEKMPDWKTLELVGTIPSAFIFYVACRTYAHMLKD